MVLDRHPGMAYPRLVDPLEEPLIRVCLKPLPHSEGWYIVRDIWNYQEQDYGQIYTLHTRYLTCCSHIVLLRGKLIWSLVCSSQKGSVGEELFCHIILLSYLTQNSPSRDSVLSVILVHLVVYL